MQIHFILNHVPVTAECEPGRRLIDLLREDFGLTGTKEGCGEGECGACTVLLDSKAVHACLVLCGQLEGHEVLTVEGLAPDGVLDPLQQAFLDSGAIQCGFCTPGMIMSAKGLLIEHPRADESQIRDALSGNLCRCSAYEQIVRAVLSVSHGKEDPSCR